MTNKDSLELLNMFITATQIAKTKDKYDFHLEITENCLVELLQKAFPNLRNNTNTVNIAKKILQN